jgi:hypothetical protein
MPALQHPRGWLDMQYLAPNDNMAELIALADEDDDAFEEDDDSDDDDDDDD